MKMEKELYSKMRFLSVPSASDASIIITINYQGAIPRGRIRGIYLFLKENKLNTNFEYCRELIVNKASYSM